MLSTTQLLLKRIEDYLADMGLIHDFAICQKSQRNKSHKSAGHFILLNQI